MSDITLEKIDIVRDRTGASYKESKEALENSNGNVVDAIIFVEEKQKKEREEKYVTKDEFMNWIKSVLKKGDVTRIKVRKDGELLADIPVTAGITGAIVAGLIWAPLLAIGVSIAVVAKLSIEITREDGSVEVVNKVVKQTAEDVKSKVSDISSDVKGKVDSFTSEMKEKFSKSSSKQDQPSEEQNVYQYTVKFEDIDNKEDSNKEK